MLLNIENDEEEIPSGPPNRKHSRFGKFLIKWLLCKPMTKLSYIVNGKSMGETKWYQKEYKGGKPTWPWLLHTAYKLAKYNL